MTFAKQNSKIPEGINTSQEHPFKDFLLLFSGISGLIAITVVLLVLFAQSLSSYIPFEYEEKLSGIYEKVLEELSTPEMETNVETYLDAEIAIQELGAALSINADLPQNITIKFNLVSQSNIPNAFATLGGHIFITTGLLNQVSSENALSMVIAHEIAHVKYRHPIQALSSGLFIELVLGVVLGGQDSAAIQSLFGQTSLITLLSFNRDMELEADSAAHHMLIERYGHLYNADEFFVKMAELGNKSGWKEVFQTHPDVEKRIEKLNNKKHPSSFQEIITATPLDSRILKLIGSQDGRVIDL